MALFALLSAAAVLLQPAVGFGFELQGHRGARGLMPENTLAGFARALEIGVSTLELDVGVTADDRLAVLHDRRLNPDIVRSPGGEYVREPTPLVRASTLSELQRYDVGVLRPGSAYAANHSGQTAVPGARIPALEEVFALGARAEAVRFNVETKLSPLRPEDTTDPDTFARLVVAAVRDAGMAGRTTVQSFDWRSLAAVQRLAPGIPTGYLSSERRGFDTIGRGKPGPSPWTAGLDVDDHGGSVPRLVRAAGGTVWSPDARDLTAEALAEAHALGLTVVVWTVNKRDDMVRLIEMGVDGIITDYPDVLRAVMADRGMTLPPAVTP